MRRFRTITLALCAMALAMGGTSCKKEKENNVQSGDRMVIGANIEQGGSKTHIDSEIDGQFPVLWSADDSFTLYAKENTTGSTFTIREGGADKTSAQFEGEKPEGNAPYLAMYPTSGRYSGNKVFTYDIPAIQNSENIEHAGPMVGYSADGKNVSFQNAASWIRIGLKGTAKVAKVVLTYKTSSKPVGYPALSGRLQITVKDDGTIEDTEIVPIAPGKDDVPTLTLEKTAELGDSFTYFGFLVPERAFGSDNGIDAVFTVLDANGKTLATIEKSIPSVERGMVYVSEYGTAIAPAPTKPAGALSGVFTVDGDGKQVYFSEGNLYYDGSNFKLEANQYYTPTSWSTGHISHFYWSKDAEVACAQSYSESGTSISDVFFTNETKTTANASFKVNVESKDQSGWRTLSNEEWTHLLNVRTMTYDKPRYTKNMAGINIGGTTYYGIFIYPDDYNGNEVGSGGPSNWADIKNAGIAFFPAAGNRVNDGVSHVGDNGSYSSSVALSSSTESRLFFNATMFNSNNSVPRDAGISVRLVIDVE